MACLHAVSFGTFIKTSLINKQTKRNTCFTQYVTHKAFVLGSRTYKKLEVMLLKFKETWHIHFKKKLDSIALLSKSQRNIVGRFSYRF